jgi:Uma2 family endonuclease
MNAEADLPRRHRLTVADYCRMAEVGILDPDSRVELIDGDIIDMAPPDSPHAATVAYAAVRNSCRARRDVLRLMSAPNDGVHATQQASFGHASQLERSGVS